MTMIDAMDYEYVVTVRDRKGDLVEILGCPNLDVLGGLMAVAGDDKTRAYRPFKKADADRLGLVPSLICNSSTRLKDS